jgi:hypothetical protein
MSVTMAAVKYCRMLILMKPLARLFAEIARETPPILNLYYAVIARSGATKQSSAVGRPLDCFASLE